MLGYGRRVSIRACRCPLAQGDKDAVLSARLSAQGATSAGVGTARGHLATAPRNFSCSSSSWHAAHPIQCACGGQTKTLARLPSSLRSQYDYQSIPRSISEGVGCNNNSQGQQMHACTVTRPRPSPPSNTSPQFCARRGVLPTVSTKLGGLVDQQPPKPPCPRTASCWRPRFLARRGWQLVIPCTIVSP